MTQTIEEAAKTIAKDFIMEHKSRINNDAPLTHECVQYAIGRIFAMPLSERLTAEEKERVRKVYRRNCAEIAKYDNDVITAHSEGVMHALELFFGTDFFKEDE